MRAAILLALLLGGCSPVGLAAASAGLGVAAQSLGVVGDAADLVRSVLPAEPTACTAATPQ